MQPKRQCPFYTSLTQTLFYSILLKMLAQHITSRPCLAISCHKDKTANLSNILTSTPTVMSEILLGNEQWFNCFGNGNKIYFLYSLQPLHVKGLCLNGPTHTTSHQSSVPYWNHDFDQEHKLPRNTNIIGKKLQCDCNSFMNIIWAQLCVPYFFVQMYNSFDIPIIAKVNTNTACGIMTERGNILYETMMMMIVWFILPNPYSFS